MMHIRAHRLASASLLSILVSAATGAGCESERPPLGRPVCNAWKTEISALVTERCAECHGAQEPAAGYALHDYNAALAPDPTGQLRILPSDPTSRILTIFDTDATHGALSAAREPLERWVVSCDARYVKTDLHATGIMKAGHVDFHGALLRDNLYDLDTCRDCHGEDLAGGGAEASCLTCHTDGPDDCSTCHGDVPTSEPHRVHLEGGALARPVECETCHVVPETLLAPGHVLTAAGARDLGPAEVRLIGPAVDPDHEPAPTYDSATGRCSDVYCHGGTYEDAAAQNSTPAWSDSGPLGCDDCHGAPPADHPGDECARCHLPTVDAEGQLADLSLHLDGTVQLGDPELGCYGCHGSEMSPAPAPDLAGNTSRRTITVGAHARHLFPRRGLGAATECSECHLVPTDVRDPGHLDRAPAEVFPEVEGVGVLARTDGANPVWDPTAATCSDVYCHGGGEQLGRDQTPTLIKTLVWTDPVSQQVYCGSCHGVPPTTRIHESITRQNQCVNCHERSVDEFGRIILQGEPGAQTSEHIDGQVFR